MIDDKFTAAIMACAMLIVVGFTVAWAVTPKSIRCTFDRNEIGPMGTYGQWWWDIYKCSDGTERRELVAGPRG